MPTSIDAFIESNDLMAWGSALVRQAANGGRDGRDGSSWREKAPKQIVSAADEAVQAFILDSLKHRFPDCQVVSEEIPPRRGPVGPMCWVLDPLDGTANYVAGIPIFCVSLALLFEGTPVLAWTADPLRGELFAARQGHGAFLNDQRLAIGRQTPAVLLAAESGLFEGDAPGPGSEELAALSRRWGELRAFGSQALELAWVAAGRLAAAIAPCSRLWDDAAGALLVREAGGEHCGWDGRPIYPLDTNSAVFTGHPFANVAGCAEIVHWIVAREWQPPRPTEETQP